MTEAATLPRTHFSQSRDREYFDKSELAAMTGQPPHRFADVIFKELADNGLDAAENAGVPPVLAISTCLVEKTLLLRIRDNGGGMPPEVIDAILDFKTRTSDKAAYRGVTRGLQGNALKTVLGIPYALNRRLPLMIETRGKRHFLRPNLDPAGNVYIDHRIKSAEDRGGTAWTVPLPISMCGRFHPERWARGYAMFNPHASVKFQAFRKWCKQAKPHQREVQDFYHSEVDGPNSVKIDALRKVRKQAKSLERERPDFYRPAVSFPEEWTKFLPTDLIPINWYDAGSLTKLVFNHIAAARQGARDLTLRDFIAQFPGFTSTTRRMRVRQALPSIQYLSDFAKEPRLVGRLLSAMKSEAGRAPKPEILGVIGKERFFQRFDDWYGVVRSGDGEPRFWYAKAALVEDSIPYVFEAALAETEDDGEVFHGINFAPTFEDPFAGSHLVGDRIKGFGLNGFLQNAHAQQHPRFAVAVHLVSPAIKFLDKGKTRLDLGNNASVKAAISEALWKIAKVIYSEEEKRQKDAAKQRRAEEARARASAVKKLDLTEVMPLAMPEALEHATGGKYRVSAHTLFYSARPIFQKYTSKILESQYFEQTLLPEYLRAHPELANRIYREARGTLYEPHGGQEVPLGTREVEGYHFPAWRYRSILFVEKQGLYPALKQARLGERFDMAIVAGEGYATEACRVLFSNAERGDYRLFVVHDADPWGYNIARTLREETKRMPGYNVAVNDLGLKLKDALDLGLQLEDAYRKKDLPQGLELTPLEHEHFDGEKEGKGWWYRRVELNAFTAPQLIAYIEDGLKKFGGQYKVVPDPERLPGAARLDCESLIKCALRNELDKYIPGIDSMCERLYPRLVEKMKFGEGIAWINEEFSRQPDIAWDAVVKNKMSSILSQQGKMIEEEVERAVRENGDAA